MSEPARDEQYLEDSAIASRARMPLDQWADEIRREDADELLALLFDPFVFAEAVVALYKEHYDDSAEMGYRIKQIIDLAILDEARDRMETFVREEL